MKSNDKIIEGKNGLRNYQFERVQKDKSKYHHNPQFGSWTEMLKGMFYTKNCLYCDRTFEAKRVETAFCCQGCQKAHLRLRNKFISNSA